MGRRRKKKQRIFTAPVIIILIMAGALGYAAAETDFFGLDLNFDIGAVKDFFNHKFSSKKSAPEKTEETADDVSISIDDSLYDDDEELHAIIDDMDLYEKVCQLFITTPEALTSVDPVLRTGDLTKKKYDEVPVGGLVYDSGNFTDASQTTNMIADLQEYVYSSSGIRLFTAVEEEGGELSPAAKAFGEVTTEQMYSYKGQGADTAFNNARNIASYLNSYNLNMDLAPVTDTWTVKDRDYIGGRAYAGSYDSVSKLIPSAVKGFHAGNTICVLKHFPGYGNAKIDDETGMAETSKNLKTLRSEDIMPFINGIDAGADMVMTGHIIAPDVDELPASISEIWTTGVLRDLIDYDGIIITDDLSKPAINYLYSTPDAVIKAIQAGADMVYVTKDLQASYNAVFEAVKNGTITKRTIEESLIRILRVKDKYGLLGSSYPLNRVKAGSSPVTVDNASSSEASDAIKDDEDDGIDVVSEDQKKNDAGSDNTKTSDAGKKSEQSSQKSSDTGDDQDSGG